MLLAGATQVVTCRGPARARRGREMAELDVVADGAVLVRDGRVAAVGRYRDLKPEAAGVPVAEITGVLFPGFVDAHTHAVFGMPRLADHERRARGRGVLVLTGHVGNWELAGAYPPAVGLPLAAGVKPPANPPVARHAGRGRRRPVTAPRRRR